MIKQITVIALVTIMYLRMNFMNYTESGALIPRLREFYLIHGSIL